MKPVVVCACRFCHDGEGVDVNDPVEAALACPRCYANHSHAIRLIESPRRTKYDIPRPFDPPRPADAAGDPNDYGEGPEE